MVWSVTEDNMFIIIPGDPFLVYSGVPAAGNLVLAIASVGGVDQFGNSFNPGLSIETAGITFMKNDGTTQGAIFGIGGGGGVELEAFAGQPVSLVSGIYSIVLLDTIGMQFGPNGPGGKYYAESVQLPAQVIATGGAAKVITSLIQYAPARIFSDYGSQFNLATGTWTCPETGPYLFTMDNRYAAWVAGSNSESLITNTTSGETYPGGSPERNAGRIVNTREIWATKNDVFTFAVFQDTAANQTIQTLNSYISIHRWL